MKIFKSACTALALLAVNINTAHAMDECISFNQNQRDFEAIEQQFNAFDLLIKNGNLDLGNGKTRNGPAYYRPGNGELSRRQCNDNATALFMNGSNLYISIAPTTATVNRVEIDYCDFGGVNNLSARQQKIDFIGKLHEARGKVLENFNGDNTNVDIRGFRRFVWGTLGEANLLNSDIREVIIGGEELFISRICFYY